MPPTQVTFFRVAVYAFLRDKAYIHSILRPSNQLYPVVLREQLGQPTSGDVILTKPIGNAKRHTAQFEIVGGWDKKDVIQNQGFAVIPIPLALNVSVSELQRIKEDHEKCQNEGIENTQR